MNALQTNTPPVEELLTASELASITKIKRNTLYQLAREERIPSLQTPGGKLRRFRLSEVMSTLEAHRKGTLPR